MKLLLTAALVAFAMPANAQACADRTLIVERLANKYGETRQSAGLNQNNDMVEVFASEETGTWTILVTMPNGKSCFLTVGKAWQAEVAAPKDDPA